MGIAKNNSRSIANDATEKWWYWKTTKLENYGTEKWQQYKVTAAKCANGSLHFYVLFRILSLYLELDKGFRGKCSAFNETQLCDVFITFY